jgi:hemoglobin
VRQTLRAVVGSIGEGTSETLAHSVAVSVYDHVGTEFFTTLVDRFYDAVETDPALRPLYPERLEASRAHLAGFLVQYWGGPATYSEERGHPRLRLRHAPFAIGRVERDAWFDHMAAAVRSMEAAPEIEAAMLDYFAQAATAMINTGLSQFTSP